MGTIKPGHRRDVIFFIFNLKKSTLETHNKKNFLGQNFSRLRRLSALQLQADILYRFDNESRAVTWQKKVLLKSATIPAKI